MAQITFPQHGDEPDAAYFAAMIGQEQLSDYVETGIEITNLDAAAPTIDVSAGKAFVVRETMDTASSDISPTDTVDHAGAFVQFDGATDFALDDGAVNYVWLDPDVASDDNASLASNTTGAKPAPSNLLVAIVDTTNDTFRHTSREQPIVASSVEWANAQDGLPSGDALLLGSRALQDGESLRLVQAQFMTADGQAVADGVALGIATLAGDGTGTWQSSTLVGDGASIYADANPIDSNTMPDTYENTSGGEQTVAVLIDNGHFAGAPGGAGSDTPVYADVTGVIV